LFALNLFDAIRDGALDREEEDDDRIDSDEEEGYGEMSEEEEFIPYEDDDDTGSDDSDKDTTNQKVRTGPSLSASEEVTQGTVVRTRVFKGKDGSEWRGTATQKE